MTRKPQFGTILLGCLLLVPVWLVIALAGTSTYLFTRQPIWRATTKLLVTRWGTSAEPPDTSREEQRAFIETQCSILYTAVLQQRVRERLKRSPEDLRDNLRGFTAQRAGGSDLIYVSVDSPSREFARDYANTLADELMKFREEQRASDSENALLLLTREINRLSQETKAANQRMIDYLTEHHLEGTDQPNSEQHKIQLLELQGLRDNKERLQSLYNVLLGQLMKIDMSQNFSARNVSILEPALVGRDPVYPRKAASLAAAVVAAVVFGLLAAPALAGLAYWVRQRRYEAAHPTPPVIH